MNQREFCVTQSGTISSGGMYGSNITDSYGTISPNRNHTNETINAFRISSSGDIDGRNWIFTTGSYGIWQEYTSKFIQKYWWLRSPSTDVFDYDAWLVLPSGYVSYTVNYFVYDSYGRRSPGKNFYDTLGSPNVASSVDSSGDVSSLIVIDLPFGNVSLSSYGFIRINLSIITEK